MHSAPVMFYLPVSFLLFIIFVLLLPFVWFALTVDVVQVAAAKLGFSPSAALWILLAIILGSMINIPLYRAEAKVELLDDWIAHHQQQFWGIPFQQFPQATIVALNVGGGLIPIGLALYQFRHAPAGAILLVTTIVTMISYGSAQVVPGIGIQMNPVLAPLTAALSAVLVAGSHAPAVAFAGGVLGTLIGADLLHLKDVTRMSAGVLSIGGAGVFDGIALCGLFALLLT